MILITEWRFKEAAVPASLSTLEFSILVRFPAVRVLMQAQLDQHSGGRIPFVDLVIALLPQAEPDEIKRLLAAAAAQRLEG